MKRIEPGPARLRHCDPLVEHSRPTARQVNSHGTTSMKELFVVFSPVGRFADVYSALRERTWDSSRSADALRQLNYPTSMKGGRDLRSGMSFSIAWSILVGRSAPLFRAVILRSDDKETEIVVGSGRAGIFSMASIHRLVLTP